MRRLRCRCDSCRGHSFEGKLTRESHSACKAPVFGLRGCESLLAHHFFQRPASELVNAAVCKTVAARCDPGAGLPFPWNMNRTSAPGHGANVIGPFTGFGVQVLLVPPLCQYRVSSRAELRTDTARTKAPLLHPVPFSQMPRSLIVSGEALNFVLMVRVHAWQLFLSCRVV